jgi:hypothetical protein
MMVNQRTILARFARNRVQWNRDLFRRLDDSIRDEARRLEECQIAIEEGDDPQERAFEVQCILENCEDIAQLRCVDLYRSVEALLNYPLQLQKQIVDSKRAGAKRRHFSRLEEIEKELLNKCGISISALVGYSAIDEIRTVNNCIKHGGRVSNVLSKKCGNKYGVEGEPISYVEASIEDLRNQVVPFFEQLANEWDQATKKQLKP